MQAPSVAHIETGAEIMAHTSDRLSYSQRKELHSFGDARAQSMGATGLTEDFYKGYELGLATARAVIADSMAAIKGGSPADIL